MKEPNNLVVITEDRLKELLEETIRKCQPPPPVAQDRGKQDEFLTRKETANLLKITLQTLNEWQRRGKVTAYRPGGGRRVLYKRDEVYAMLKEIPNLKRLHDGYD